MVQIIQINLVLKNVRSLYQIQIVSSNNTNKLSPQELNAVIFCLHQCSNNTNKLSPQERGDSNDEIAYVQIIQINLVLKNGRKKDITPSLFK